MGIRVAVSRYELKTTEGTKGKIRLEALAFGSTYLRQDAVALRLAVLLLRYRGVSDLIVATDVVDGGIQLEDL